MNKITLTIGIPAHNEEANIGQLLLSLLRQKIDNVNLKEIIIVSDGSTDNTVKAVRSIRDARISVVDRKNRLGLNRTQNEILRKANGDVLVLLDADVLPESAHFLHEMTEPFQSKKKIGIVGADIHPLLPGRYMERVLAYSHIFKKYIYKRIDSGNNIYLCHGRARAFAKSFYKTLVWPKDCPEDAYSYLFCVKNGYQFVYQKSARVWFRSPTTLEDHIKQSKRFVSGIDILKKHFPQDFVDKNFVIPRTLLVNALRIFFLKGPVSFSTYLAINFYIRFINKKQYRYESVYDASPSTKKLISSFRIEA